MSNTRFFSQIPAWVDDLDNVSDFQVRLLGFIYTLSNTGQHAFPSNSFLADKYHKTTRSVQRALSDLYEKGLLKSTVKYKDGTTIIEKRYLELIEPGVGTQTSLPNDKNVTPLGTQTSLPQGHKRPYPRDKNVLDNRLTNKLTNRLDTHKGVDEVIDPMLASKMLAAYNKATERNNKNTGTFSSLAMKNVSLEDFQDVLNYMVATFSSVEYITVKSLIGRFEEHLTSANERGFVDGKIPKPKNAKGKQEPKIATNADIQQQQKQPNQPQEDLMAILNGRKTHV